MDLRDIAEQIKERVSISDYISEKGVILKRNGNKLTGLCPFHSEKTPSFNVSEHFKNYKCFGCGASGDVISFRAHSEKITLSETIRKFAEELGLSFEQLSEEKIKIFAMKREKHSIYNGLLEKFKKNRSIEHIQFLEEKYGLTFDTIEEAGIGFIKSEDFEDLTTEQKLLTGFFKISEGGDLRCSALNRIVFPHFFKNNVEHFTNRAVSNDKGVIKSLNLRSTLEEHEAALISSETEKDGVIKTMADQTMPFFTPEEVVKNPVLRDTLFITEGIGDALAISQLGFRTAAILNNRLQEKSITHLITHVKASSPSIKRFVLFCDHDPNNAGFEGALASFKLMYECGATNVFILKGSLSESKRVSPEEDEKLDPAEIFKIVSDKEGLTSAIKDGIIKRHFDFEIEGIDFKVIDPLIFEMDEFIKNDDRDSLENTTLKRISNMSTLSASPYVEYLCKNSEFKSGTINKIINEFRKTSEDEPVTSSEESFTEDESDKISKLILENKDLHVICISVSAEYRTTKDLVLYGKNGLEMYLVVDSIPVFSNIEVNHFFESKFGFNLFQQKNKPIYASILGKLMSKAIQIYDTARKGLIHNWKDSNGDENIIISLAKQGNKVVRINKSGVFLENNPHIESKTILLANPKSKPINVVPLDNDSYSKGIKLFKKLFIEKFTCSEEEGFLLLGCVFAVILSHKCTEARAMLSCQGESSAGKTSSMKLISTLLYDDFKVGTVTASRAYDLLEITPLVVLDNDEQKEDNKARDSLLRSSTTSFSRKKHGRDIDLQGMVAVTSITEGTKKDILQRTIDIFFSKKYYKKDGGNIEPVFEKIRENRDLLLTVWFEMTRRMLAGGINMKLDKIRKEYLRSSEGESLLGEKARLENFFSIALCFVSELATGNNYSDKEIKEMLQNIVALQSAKSYANTSGASQIQILLDIFLRYIQIHAKNYGESNLKTYIKSSHVIKELNMYNGFIHVILHGSATDYELLFTEVLEYFKIKNHSISSRKWKDNYIEEKSILENNGYKLKDRLLGGVKLYTIEKTFDLNKGEL